jgi:CHAT domain-containing protein/tetratricopeptide (TPR) repeat protein
MQRNWVSPLMGTSIAGWPENGPPRLGSTLRNSIGRFARKLAPRCGFRTYCLGVLALAVSMAASSVALFAQEKQASQENKLLRLEPGKTIEEVLSAGEAKSFQVTLEAGEYAEITITPSPDLFLYAVLEDPGAPRKLDTLFGVTVVPLLASTARTFRGAIERAYDGEHDGRVQVTLSIPRPSRPDDAARWAAVEALAEADALPASSRDRLQKYQVALSLWQQIGDRRQEALTLLQIGKAYNDFHENNLAMDYTQRALSAIQALGLRSAEISATATLASTYANQHEELSAAKYYKRTLELSRELHNDHFEAFALMGLARHDSSADRMGFLHRALDIYKAQHDGRGIAYASEQLGREYLALGKDQEGMDSLRRSLEAARAVHDGFFESYILLSLAAGYADEGDLRGALDCYMQALPLQKSRQDSWGEGRAYSQIATMYLSLGQPDKALEYARQALVTQQRLQNRSLEADALWNVGEVHSELGDYATALSHFERALALYREVSNRAGEAGTLLKMGEVQAKQARLQEALLNYNQALVIYRAGSSSNPYMRRGEANVETDIASAKTSLGQTGEALAALRHVLDLLPTIGYSREGEANVLYELARAERAAGHLEEAMARSKAALDLTERLRGTVSGADMRASYVARVRERYELLIALLMQLHRRHPGEGYDVKGLEASERARARGLLDLLNESRTDVTQGTDPELLERKRSLQAELNFKEAYRIQLLSKSHSDQEISTLEKEINRLTSEYEETEAQIRTRSPRYANLTQAPTLGLSEIQRLLAPDTVLLEYSLGRDGSYLWVVTPGGLKSFVLPGRSEIEALARRAYAEISVNDPTGGQSATVALGRMLLGSADLPQGTRLAIVAEGALEYIPFAALRTSPRAAPLIARHEIVALPSASTLSLLRQETEGRAVAAKQVAVLADPVFRSDDPRVTGRSLLVETTARERPEEVDRAAKESGLLNLDRLPATRREAAGILSLSGPGRSLQALDFDASLETAISPELQQYQIIHFASHTLLNSNHPELSGILLSLVDPRGQPRDGFLQARQVLNLKLNANMVVLSACQTALGKEVRGEGLIGLSRAFMYAGAPRVVASLWRVPDNATAELMRRFYRAMFIESLPPSAALRKSELALQRDPRWSAPYYWAGFSLQGDWK